MEIQRYRHIDEMAYATQNFSTCEEDSCRFNLGDYPLFVQSQDFLCDDDFLCKAAGHKQFPLENYGGFQVAFPHV